MDTYLELFRTYLEGNGKSKNTTLAYLRDVKLFFSYCTKAGVVEIEQITSDIIKQHLSHVQSNRTVARKLSILKNFFDFLIVHGIVSDNPATRVPVPQLQRTAPKSCTFQDIKKLLSVMSCEKLALRDRLICSVLVDTGLDVDTVLSLKVSDLDQELGCIKIGEGLYPLKMPVVREMQRYVRAQDKYLQEDTFLFLNAHGGKLSRQGLWKNIKKYANQAGIENFTLSMLKRTGR